MNVLNASELYANFKIVKMVNFMLCKIYHTHTKETGEGGSLFFCEVMPKISALLNPPPASRCGYGETLRGRCRLQRIAKGMGLLQGSSSVPTSADFEGQTRVESGQPCLNPTPRPRCGQAGVWNMF